jgi:hypothetical protein
MHVQFRIGRVPFLGLCCVLLAASLIGRHVLAQKPTAPEPKLTTTTVADNRYGEGGTKETTSDEKYKIHREVWKDKNGEVREVHDVDYDSAGQPNSESWSFSGTGGKKLPYYLGFLRTDNGTWILEKNQVSPGIPAEVTLALEPMTLETIEEEIEAIEKQFAKDGTLPPNAFRKDEGVKTNVEQPTLQAIAACLIGTWECKSFKEGNRFFTGGGTGFRVTFNKDGTETVDYSSMQPIKAGPIDKIAYTGTASARISTLDGVAKIESMQKAGVMMTVDSRVGNHTVKIPSLGPGGLGSADKSSYTCNGDSLEYQTSTRLDQHANCTVKLTRVKP